jgi:hypothetical protein
MAAGTKRQKRNSHITGGREGGREPNYPDSIIYHTQKKKIKNALILGFPRFTVFQ